ncbi:hypothetical protein ACHAXS_001196, partial [Conticribra weissflogii]
MDDSSSKAAIEANLTPPRHDSFPDYQESEFRPNWDYSPKTNLDKGVQSLSCPYRRMAFDVLASRSLMC